MTGPRVSIDDLLFAVDWLAEGYEGDPDEDENVARGQRVAAWLVAEINRRQEAAAVRQIAARSGRPTSVARAAYRSHTAAQGGA